MDDNLELLSIKCPHCTEVTRVDQWVTMAVKTTSCSASFSFMGKPKNSNSLMCPKCKEEILYLDVIEAMIREQ